MTFRHNLLLSCPYGDPLDEHTWSGTVKRLADALRATDVALTTLHSDLSRAEKFALRALNRARGLGPTYRLATPARRLASLRVAARARRVGAVHVLHTGTQDIPLQPNGLKHYLYCDTTWNLWRDSLTVRDMPREMLAMADRLDRQAYRQVEHFFACAAATRDDLVENYGIAPERISVVGTGRGNIAPYWGPKDYLGGQILFAGRHRLEEKGGLLLIEAFKIARRARPGLRLVIAGSDEYKPLEREVANLTVTGSLAWPALQRLFEQSALYAMPATNEPWGLVYLEALACRTPLLGLRANGYPEIAGDGAYGFIVDKPEPAAIAASLVAAFDDPDRLERMGAAGQVYCLREFTWENVASKMLRGMSLVLERRRP